MLFLNGQKDLLTVIAFDITCKFTNFILSYKNLKVAEDKVRNIHCPGRDTS